MKQLLPHLTRTLTATNIVLMFTSTEQSTQMNL